MTAEIKISGNINDLPQNFTHLFNIWQFIQENQHKDFIFNFSGCGFLQQNAVAFIGGLVRLIELQGNTVDFELDSIEDRVLVNLKQNGFLYTLGFTEPPWEGNSIPYREDVTNDSDSFIDYLLEKWLGRGWVTIDDPLKNHIAQPIIEAYVNVFDHARSPVGVITCGQHYPNRRRLKLAMVDFGIGIPQTVKDFLKQPELSPSDALRWAFEANNSTKLTGPARGVGLKLLKDFIEDNGGKLEIYSDTGYACIQAGRDEVYIKRRSGFNGTLVQITLQCDTTMYPLPSIQDFDSGDDWF